MEHESDLLLFHLILINMPHNEIVKVVEGKFRVTSGCHGAKVKVSPKCKCSGTLRFCGLGATRVQVCDVKHGAVVSISSDGYFFVSGAMAIAGPMVTPVSILSGVPSAGSPIFPANSSTPSASQFVLRARGSYVTSAATNLTIAATLATAILPGTSLTAALTGNGTFDYEATYSSAGSFGKLTFGNATGTTTLIISNTTAYGVNSELSFGIVAMLDVAGSTLSVLQTSIEFVSA